MSQQQRTEQTEGTERRRVTRSMSRTSTSSIVAGRERVEEPVDPTVVPTPNQSQPATDPVPVEPDETFQGIPGGFDRPRSPITIHNPIPRMWHTPVKPRDI